MSTVWSQFVRGFDSLPCLFLQALLLSHVYEPNPYSWGMAAHSSLYETDHVRQQGIGTLEAVKPKDAACRVITSARSLSYSPLCTLHQISKMASRSGTHKAVSVGETGLVIALPYGGSVSVIQTYFGAPLYVIFHTPHSISFISVGTLSVRFFFLTYTNPH